MYRYSFYYKYLYCFQLKKASLLLIQIIVIVSFTQFIFMHSLAYIFFLIEST